MVAGAPYGGAMAEKIIKNALFKAQLAGVVFANVLLFWLCYHAGELVAGDVSSLLDQWQKSALIPGLAAVVAVGFARLFDETTKARMVYLRWKHPLPGCRAFSVLALKDPRVDLARLEAKLGPLPVEPDAQNTLWFSIYKPNRAQPEIVTALGDYLLMRDWATIALAMSFLTAPLAFLIFENTKMAAAYLIFLLVQFGIAILAASNSGVRLVTNALAIKSSEG